MKAAPTRMDRNRIWKMFHEGLDAMTVSAVTKVKREHVEIVFATIRDGRFKGPKEAQRPLTALEVAKQESMALQAELDQVKADLEAARVEEKPKRGRPKKVESGEEAA